MNDDQLRLAPPGSIVVIPAADAQTEGWSAVVTIANLQGDQTATLARRAGS
jgi:hypothetical protein